MNRFLLSAIDPALGCAVLQILVPVPDLEQLRPFLEWDQEHQLSWGYELDATEATVIAKHFGVEFDPGGRTCMFGNISDWRPDDWPPYLGHQGYELALLLEGVKPFAKFSHEYPSDADALAREALFEPHVKSGLLMKRIVDHPFEKPIRLYNGQIAEGWRQLFYARRGEAWRIDAELLLQQKELHGQGWNWTMERLSTALLGYTEVQIDWWIARLKRDLAALGAMTAYAAVSGTDLEWIIAAGERALPPHGTGPGIEFVAHFRPKPRLLAEWMADVGAAAIVRIGAPGRFLRDREHGERDGARSFLVKYSDVPELNRGLFSEVQIVMTREMG